MDSTPMLHAFDGQQRNEYPFPVVDPQAVEPPSSPSDSLPSTTHSKTHRSDGSSRHHRRHDRDRDTDFASASARLLARLASRDDRDVKHVRTLLVLTTERLESETRRADQAEQRVIDTLHRLRSAHEATTAARSETARAAEMVQLYKLQLDYAQREINRAQEILNQVDRERADAEAEAARARSTARRLREDNLIAKAKEQGRREGFQEGLSAGRHMVEGEGRPSSLARNRRLPPRHTVEDEEDEEEEELRARSPPPHRASSATMFQISPPSSTFAPRPQLAMNFEVRQRSATPARASSRAADTAPHAPTLPVPTIVTPVAAPSPFHSQRSPSPAPVPGPSSRRQSRSQSRAEQRRSEPLDRPPIPIYNAPPSPSHPPYDILPDNFIPSANDLGEFELPPPHELSRPVTPASPNPSLPESILPVAPPVQETLMAAPAASVRSRDFAYNNRTNPSISDSLKPRGPPGTFSPQSRTSTRISEFDILGPSRSGSRGGPRSIQGTVDGYGGGPSTSTLSLTGRVPHRSRTPGPLGMDVSDIWSLDNMSTDSIRKRPPSPRGPRSHSDPIAPEPEGRPEMRRRTSSDNRGPLIQLFKKRFRGRNSPPDTGTGSGSLSAGRAVPDITVESPSTPESHTTEQTTNVPHLLSPDFASRPLPTPEQEMNMQQEPEPPLPIAVNEVFDVLPPGFIPIPSSSPAPNDQGRNRRPSGPSRPTTPYAEAPLPTGVAYPNPPARSMTPSALDELYGSASSPRTRGRGGSLSGTIGGLSPLSIGKPLTAFSFPDLDDDQNPLPVRIT
ncbi:hypothetical protein EIP91_001579 [Steccherinum ochraceum]|uniref:Uncharacterized protein n=1 Tax=Steccherinum ochraceum TaxID=92696 RepID=A0A4R0RR30_9APHY|nr:hypothetical protein EIP91_001579 [Steccherinum ochraceum]